MYDVDQDGFIGPADLLHVLKLLVGRNLSDEQLQKIVDTTISNADLDHDHKLSMEEFAKVSLLSLLCFLLALLF